MLPKECPVDRLSQGVSKGDFKHWVKTVENFLESHQAWHGATHVLRSARRSKAEIDAGEFRDTVAAAHQSGSGKLNLMDWTYEDKNG